jgi:hypothetical protein
MLGLGPRADGRQLGAEAFRDDVVGVADEDGAVPHTREPLDVLDHLGVVVRGDEGLPGVVVGHRQVPDDVGHPGIGEALSSGFSCRKWSTSHASTPMTRS